MNNELVVPSSMPERCAEEVARLYDSMRQWKIVWDSWDQESEVASMLKCLQGVSRDSITSIQ